MRAERLQTKKEPKCFLESVPGFPKTASGKIGNSQVDKILCSPLYAGYIEYKIWGVTLRKGQHEGMVSFETFQRIQNRLLGRAYVPARKDLNHDFPLRNAVGCECGNALTAGWSKSQTGKYHPYYLCQNRKCEYKGKSIRRDVLEGEFETLLKNLTPSSSLIVTADKMFRALWDHQGRSQQGRKKQLEQEGRKLDKTIEQALDCIVEAESSTVMKAFEKRIEALQRDKIVIEEKMAICGQSVKPYDGMYRTALKYLENPLKVWSEGGYVEKRTVIKLTITVRLIYDRKQGYRTPNLSLPFKDLNDFIMPKNKMVPSRGIEPRTRGFSVPCSTD